MRDITAQLESYQDHLDEMYPAVTSDELRRFKSDRARVRSPNPLWRRVYAFGAALALVLGLGIIALVLVGGEQTAELADGDPADVVPTVPQGELADGDPADVGPTVPLTPTSATPSTTAPTTPTTTAPTATPPTGGPIQLTEVSVPWPPLATGVLDPLGRLVAAYWSQDERAMMLMRCADPDCIEPPTVVKLASLDTFQTEGEPYPPQIDDMALRPDGSPILIVWSADQVSHTIYACADPACGTVQAMPLGIAGVVSPPQVAIASDGLPRIVYWSADSRNLELIVCGDATCDIDSRHTVTIETDIWVPVGASIRIDPDGRVLIGYTTEGSSHDMQARIAVCTDESCSRGPTIVTFDDATGPRTTASPDGGFFVWYLTGPFEELLDGDRDVDAIVESLHLMVASCDSGGCDEPRRVEVGWALLHSWQESHLVTMPDGAVAALYSYWAQDSCTQYVDVVVLEPRLATMKAELGHYPGGPILMSEVSPDGILLTVMYDELAGTLDLREVSTEPGQAEPGAPPAPCQ